MNVIADIVLNHKIGGDEKEEFPVVDVRNENRTELISEKHLTEAYTRFISLAGKANTPISFGIGTVSRVFVQMIPLS